MDDPDRPRQRIGLIALDYHTDGSDLVGLMCLRAAKSGGLSCVANVGRDLQRTRPKPAPDLVAALYEALPWDFRGEQPPGGQALLHAQRVHRARRPPVRSLRAAIHQSVAAPPGCAATYRPAARSDRHGERNGRPAANSTSIWNCRRARCSSSTTTTCCTAAPPTRTMSLRLQASSEAAVARDAISEIPAARTCPARPFALEPEPLGKPHCCPGARTHLIKWGLGPPAPSCAARLRRDGSRAEPWPSF